MEQNLSVMLHNTTNSLIHAEHRMVASIGISNQTRRDAISLNLQRAREAAIAAVMHVVRIKRLGLPQESREAFRLLEDAGLLTGELSQHMQAMVGFRNIAVHEYQKGYRVGHPDRTTG